MSFCNKLKPKSAATSARQTPVAAGASATRCFTIKPDARTSERWSRDECYPANLVPYEVWPQDIGVPAGRLTDGVGSAGGENQLPGNIVKIGPHSVQGAKRPCPHCPDGANFFTKFLTHKKNTAGNVSHSRLRCFLSS
jgi:hypothetical protein